MWVFIIRNYYFQLDQADLGMISRDYYMKGTDDVRLVAYEEFALEVAILFGANTTRAKKEMREMVLFEINLANVIIIRMRFLLTMY